MSWRDRISFLIPSFEDSDGKTIEVVDPEARGITANIVIGTAIFSLLVMVVIEVGIVSQSEYVWVPLGTILFLMAVNPIIRLDNYWEAILILLMYTNYMAFIIIYFEESITNAMIISLSLMLIVFVFEYPRRFGLK